MNWELLILFIVLNAVNVVIQTVKSLVTVKCGKMPAAIVNALAYGLYTVVVVYMVCELPLFWKVVIVGLCNFIGVYAVKWFEEKARKDKLWKIEFTVRREKTAEVKAMLDLAHISSNYIDNIGKYTLFNAYSETQKDSIVVHENLKQFNAKYFVTESKSL